MYSTPWTSKYAFVHCIFPSLRSGKYNREESITAVLHVPVEGTDQSPFPVLPMAWSVCFSFFITETAVNYWLTWVLITMQIWGKMKSKAAGSCHICLQKIHDWREGCYGLDLCCQMAVRWKERKFNLGYCFVHLMTITIKKGFYGRHKSERRARKNWTIFYISFSMILLISLSLYLTHC